VRQVRQGACRQRIEDDLEAHRRPQDQLILLGAPMTLINTVDLTHGGKKGHVQVHHGDDPSSRGTKVIVIHDVAVSEPRLNLASRTEALMPTVAKSLAEQRRADRILRS
jgi:hypothetical protein